MKKRPLLFLCLLAGLTAAAQSLSVPYEKFTLANGLTVILHQDNTIPRATVNVWYHVGSGSEKPGRTGFAHLFEHILFEGSEHVPEGKFDQWLEAAGASNNGSTWPDRTIYYEDMPSNALDLALFLESDRMGFLLNSLDSTTVDGQRDVVKNERRQNYEDRPYGMSWLETPPLLYPKDHPYSWSGIGSMEDLSAASLQDVKDFFRKFYAPGNASICIAGDIDLKEARQKVEKWFSDVKPGERVLIDNIPVARLQEEKRVVLEDRVELPQLRISWLTPPAFQPGEAEVNLIGTLLAEGKNSRLYKRLIYENQLAQSIEQFNWTKRFSSDFHLMITARPGVTLSEIEKVVQEEIDRLKSERPSERELQRVVNQYESMFIKQLESVGFKADQLNNYYFFTGNPDYFNEDLQRYKAIAPDDITTAAQLYFRDDARVVMSIVPAGRKELAATKK